MFRSPGAASRGRLVWGPLSLPCGLGRGGLRVAKREGDGATPVGRMRPLAVLYRPDRTRRPATRLPVRPIGRHDGWCDDPGHPAYNRPIALPASCSHERMWREDRLYDLVVDLSHNRRPRVLGRGSAIFLHAARPGFAPTEGCIALAPGALRRIVERLGPRTRIQAGAGRPVRR